MLKGLSFARGVSQQRLVSSERWLTLQQSPSALVHTHMRENASFSVASCCAQRWLSFARGLYQQSP